MPRMRSVTYIWLVMVVAGVRETRGDAYTTCEDQNFQITMKGPSLSQGCEEVHGQLVLSDQASQEMRCPRPYAETMGECFYVSNFALKWEEAERYCQEMDGDLATPKHVPALQLLLEDHDVADFLWLGGNDRPYSGIWLWLDGRHVDHAHFRPGHPWTSDTSNSYCLLMGWKNHPPLETYFCRKMNNFVCQHKP
ncbi:low affinity immunoglobulin epsilon Fc receptor-like [Penaeus japonicus]|uniref:low affinity immunoglobulin epsilon Fc receptor-like n=1 Tax=Penaeus japonicus TaxID=27405 RepID=UPI001C714BAE|nr:low affinity immunoglobulin epsilon Fc receptor-like [Penaeus japonicus]